MLSRICIICKICVHYIYCQFSFAPDLLGFLCLNNIRKHLTREPVSLIGLRAILSRICFIKNFFAPYTFILSSVFNHSNFLRLNKEKHLRRDSVSPFGLPAILGKVRRIRFYVPCIYF